MSNIFKVRFNELTKITYSALLSFMRANLQNQFFPVAIEHESGFGICKQNRVSPSLSVMVGHSDVRKYIETCLIYCTSRLYLSQYMISVSSQNLSLEKHKLPLPNPILNLSYFETIIETNFKLIFNTDFKSFSKSYFKI